MIVCVCNNISEKDLKKNPELINVVGSKCGVCIRDRNAEKHTTKILVPIETTVKIKPV